MLNFPSHQEVEFIRNHYPAGTRIKLIYMEDSWAPLFPGDTGTVTSVDDMGHIHMRWDNGRSLALIYGQDTFQVIQ